MQITDSHLHLNFAELDQSRQNLLENCSQKGIRRFIIPDINLVTSSLNYQFPNCEFLYSIGIHPFYIDQKKHLTHELISQANYIAIGEVGIDLRKDLHHVISSDLQIKYFEEQLKLALDHKLPLILHCVHAHDLMQKMIKKINFSYGGVVHGFTGSYEIAKEWIKLGFHLGIGSMVLKENAHKLRELILRVGLEHIIIETDAPNIKFAPNYEQTIPQCLLNILETVSKIFSLDQEQCSEQIEKNVNETFRLSSF